jgi:hypothetical protein
LTSVGSNADDQLPTLEDRQSKSGDNFEGRVCKGQRQTLHSGILAESPFAPSRSTSDVTRTAQTGLRPRLGSLRTTRNSTIFADMLSTTDYPEPPRWSVENVGWDIDWKHPLVYNPPGERGSIRATIDKSDIPRLDEGEYLNDSIIMFYLRYLQYDQEKDQPQLSKQVYFMNSWFFEKLRPAKGKGINYEGVKGWVKVDLFSYDYIVVPVNENQHWYVAIICNPSKLIPKEEDEAEEIKPPGKVVDDSTTPTLAPLEVIPEKTPNALPSTEIIHEDIEVVSGAPGRPNLSAKMLPATGIESPRSRRIGRKFDPTEPRIITLDSLGGSHSPTCTILRDYLVVDLEVRKGIRIDKPTNLGTTAKGIPQQTNYYDCGVYLLAYIREFLLSPDMFINSVLQREEVCSDLHPSTLRDEIRTIIFSLYDEQKKQYALEKKLKKEAKKDVEMSKLSLVETAEHALPSPSEVSIDKTPEQKPKISTRESSAATAISSPEAQPRTPVVAEPTETRSSVEIITHGVSLLGTLTDTSPELSERDPAPNSPHVSSPAISSAVTQAPVTGDHSPILSNEVSPTPSVKLVTLDISSGEAIDQTPSRRAGSPRRGDTNGVRHRSPRSPQTALKSPNPAPVVIPDSPPSHRAEKPKPKHSGSTSRFFNGRAGNTSQWEYAGDSNTRGDVEITLESRARKRGDYDRRSFSASSSTRRKGRTIDLTK